MAYKSKVYGGSCLDKIRNKTIVNAGIKNNLEQEIANYSLSVDGGGFYILREVKYAANVFIDIWILLEQIDRPE